MQEELDFLINPFEYFQSKLTKPFLHDTKMQIYLQAKGRLNFFKLKKGISKLMHSFSNPDILHFILRPYFSKSYSQITIKKITIKKGVLVRSKK